MSKRVLLVVALAALCAPASASAATRTVDQQAGPYTTITDALHAADPGDTIEIHQGHYDEQLSVDKDHLTLHAAPGTIVSSTAPWTISLMGAGDALQGLFVAGGAGGVRIAGDGASLTDTTVLADATGVSVEGPVTTHLLRSFLRTTGLTGTALAGRNDAVTDQITDVHTSVIVGGRAGTGIDMVSGAAGDTAKVGATLLTIGFSTIVGAPVAIHSGSVGMGNWIVQWVDPVASIVHGALQGLANPIDTDTTTPDDQLFADPAALDFHLRADAPAVDASTAGAAQPGETDFDGHPRVSGAAADRGAFEFADHPPTAVVSAPVAAADQGAPVTLDASASSDPDPGGRIVAYTWSFGDGTTAQTTTPVTTHTYADPGAPVVTVQTVDQQGLATTSAQGVTLTIRRPDRLGPALSITSPRDGARLHRYRTIRRKHHRPRRTVVALRFAGRATDPSGVAGVKLTLVRHRAKGAKAPVPVTAAATLRGAIWSWSSSARAPRPAGAYTLTVRAVDRAGNVSTPRVLHFTVT